jgi:hypothetical protein
MPSTFNVMYYVNFDTYLILLQELIVLDSISKLDCGRRKLA